MNRLRLPIRLARREVLRRPGRTVLVALLVALPVAGMSAASTLIRSGDASLEEEWRREYGAADAVVSGHALLDEGPEVRQFLPGNRQESEEDAVASLPEGSRVVRVTQGFVRARTRPDGPRSNLDIYDVPVGDPIAVGIVDVVEGRAPVTAGEVALSRSAADDLEVEVGDVLELDRPAARLRVVGLVEQPGCIGCPTSVVAPGTIGETFGLDAAGLGSWQLVDLPELSTDELTTLAAQPAVDTFEEATDPNLRPEDPTNEIRWSLVVGGVVLTVMGIVIAAAFAVGARRQLVTLGQLSASGASPATLRLSLVLQGTFTGLVGAVAGVALAMAAVLPFHDRFERLLDHRFDGYDIRIGDQLAAISVGVVAATVAALIPARTAARVPTLAALAGRRPQHPVPRRLVVAGLGGVAAGLSLLALAVLGSASGDSGDVWVFVAVLGGVCELLGACAIAPALVTRLEPLAGRVRGSWRLAARGLARHRSRTGAVVSAVAAAGALAVVSTTIVRGEDAQPNRHLDPSDEIVYVHELVEDVPTEGKDLGFRASPELPGDDAQAALEAILPDAERTELRTAIPAGSLPSSEVDDPGLIPFEVGYAVESGFTGYGFDWAFLADEPLLDLVGLSASGRRALDEDGAVLIRRHAEDPAQLLIRGGEPMPISVVPAAHAAGRGSEVLVTEAFARDHGLVIGTTELAYRSPEPLTEDQRDQIEDLMLDSGPPVAIGGEPVRFLDLTWYQPETGPSPFQLELILTGIALAFSVFIVGASLALAAAESKDERDVLTVAGAPPGALARAAGARAWLLSGLGGLLAVPIGFLPMVVFVQADDGDFPLVFPSTTVALLLVAVPTMVGLVAMASSATAQRLRPVRVSTATFE